MEAFRLPDPTHIGTVQLRVTHLERALAFYRDVLGLRLIDQSGRQARLSATGQPPALVVLVEQPDAIPKPRGTTGLFHVAIRLPQRRALARIFRHLHTVDYPLQGAADHAVSEALYLADPDGNGLELYRDRPRADWPWNDSEVTMTTERLDLRALLAEADPAPWDGIDPGTDIGHVHLSVSDLVRARAFYSDQLGFEVTQSGYPGALFLAAGGYHHHLGLNVWGGLRLVPPPPNAVGLIAYDVVLPDAQAWQAARARLAQNGHHRDVPGSDGTLRRLFQDPDQISVALVAEE